MAFGLGPRILAAGPAPPRLYSDSARLCQPDHNRSPGSSATDQPPMAKRPWQRAAWNVRGAPTPLEDDNPTMTPADVQQQCSREAVEMRSVPSKGGGVARTSPISATAQPVRADVVVASTAFVPTHRLDAEWSAGASKIRETAVDVRFRADNHVAEVPGVGPCALPPVGWCHAPALSSLRSLDDGGSVLLSTRDDHHGLATASE